MRPNRRSSQKTTVAARLRNVNSTVELGAAGLLIALVVAVAVAAFTWPSARLQPRDVPLGIAGPAPVASALEERLAKRGDAFAVHRYAEEPSARAAIEDREVYGALVASRDGMRLLTASAASPVVAELLEDAFASSERVRVVDVVPADAEDPRGVALSSLVLPLTLVSVVVGLIATRFMRQGLRRAAGLVGAALVAGLVAIAIVQGWLGVVPGEWWVNGSVLALVALAIASPIAGLAGLLGLRGFALAAALLVFCGNPWSGVSSAPELLPAWVGFTGQLLPPGAGASLLRSAAFFDGGGSAAPITVLLAWAVVGLGAVSAAALRNRRAGTERREERRERPLPRPAG